MTFQLTHARFTKTTVGRAGATGWEPEERFASAAECTVLLMEARPIVRNLPVTPFAGCRRKATINLKGRRRCMGIRALVAVVNELLSVN